MPSFASRGLSLEKSRGGWAGTAAQVRMPGPWFGGKRARLPAVESVLEQARAFWGDALDLERVRFIDSRLARLTGRAFVIHHTIHWPGPQPGTAEPGVMAVVIHELAHCWQHQTGRWQLTRGIIEQTLYTLFGWWLVSLGGRALYDPYDYGGPLGLARAARLGSFQLEAQARIMEHYWLSQMPGTHAIGGYPLTDAKSKPTPFASDLARLCCEAGLP